jgi:hypothetical protein
MSTPLTDRIEALTSQANAVTGASDTTLTDAVGTLIDGYKDGVDVTIEDVPFTNIVGLAEYLFSAIGGENMVIYNAILKTAVVPNLHKEVKNFIFIKQSSSMQAGGLRIQTSGAYAGGYYLASGTGTDATATIGDIYTVYTL